MSESNRSRCQRTLGLALAAFVVSAGAAQACRAPYSPPRYPDRLIVSPGTTSHEIGVYRSEVKHYGDRLQQYVDDVIAYARCQAQRVTNDFEMTRQQFNAYERDRERNGQAR